MLNLISKTLKLTLVVGAVLTSGCSTANQVGTLQNKYEQSLKEKVLIHMDIKTMFPSVKLRELAKAAGKGKTSIIDELIQEGIDVNSRGNGNATALFWSMRNDKGFNYLLEMGADPNVVFGDGGSVMHWVARKQDCSMLITALKHGGNPNLKAGMFGGSPAFETITAGKNKGTPPCLEVLLSNNSDIEFRDDNAKTLLLLATDLARFDVALYLLEKGADPRVKDIKGRSMRTLLNSYQGAFKQGSTTEDNWIKLKEKLDSLKW
jgi:ankyrin repeat protein